MSKQLKPVPAFASEAEERAFWESHDSADYVDWDEAQPVALPNLRAGTATAAETVAMERVDTAAD